MEIKYLEHLLTEEHFPKKEADLIKIFFSNYRQTLKDKPNVDFKALEKVFCTFIEKVGEWIKHPYTFPSFHERITEPFDYSALNDTLWEPLIDFDNSYLGKEIYLKEISEVLERKENVIFFSNHQTEPDSQSLILFLKKRGYAFGSSLISVAGDRVLTDPLAATLSLGLNILSVYSKRYMDAFPDKREERQQHNRRTMQMMSQLLTEGGKCIFVAPSGGRDRMAADGSIPISPFDPASIEMFRLMAEKSTTPTHFYPMTLSTYRLLPPPDKVQIELGEQRKPEYTPIRVTVDKEIDWSSLPTSPDKHEARELRAQAIWEMVNANYK